MTYIPGDAGDLRCENVVSRGWIVQRRTTSASLFWGWRLVGVSFPEDRLDAWRCRAGTVTAVAHFVLRGIATPAHLCQTLDVQILRGFQQRRQSRLKREIDFNQSRRPERFIREGGSPLTRLVKILSIVLRKHTERIF